MFDPEICFILWELVNLCQNLSVWHPVWLWIHDQCVIDFYFRFELNVFQDSKPGLGIIIIIIIIITVLDI